MDERLVETIREKLMVKETAELAEIFKAHDRKRWSKEAFEAIKRIMSERGKMLPDLPVEPGLKEKLLLEKPKKKERGGCLKAFLELTGFLSLLRGSVILIASIFNDFKFLYFLLGLIMFLFGVVTLYFGFHIRKAVTRRMKLIYTLVITQVVGSLVYIIYKFDLFLEPMDIALGVLNILISWAVFQSAMKLRKDFLTEEAYLPESEMQSLVRIQKTSNRSFLIVIAVIILLGVLKIGFFPTASVPKGFMLMMMGDFNKAQAEFEAVLAKKSDDQDALIGAGMCQGALKNFAKAKEYFQIVLNKDSTEPLIFLQIANMSNFAMENYDWTIEILNRGRARVKESGPESEYFFRGFNENMGWAYYKRGNLDNAKKHFAGALPLWEKFLKSQDSNESKGETHFFMGIYSLTMGDMPGAKEHLNKVLAVCQNPVFTDLAKKELARFPSADKK